VRIEKTKSTLGATVTGVALTDPSPDEWSRIYAALLEQAVLIFPSQHLSDDEQAAFGRRFGELGVEALHFTNELPDGALRPADDPLVQLLKGNEGWHTDNSYLPVSAGPSMLSARTVPSQGGETEWADMRAAFDALAPDLRERVQVLKAHHSLIESQARTGQDASATKQAFAALTSRASGEPRPAADAAAQATLHDSPPLRPLVKHHPETGRPALFIGRHAYGIQGLESSESAALLAELNDFACQPPRILTHNWQVGDFVIWDNRCVLHRVRPWDPAEARTVVHTRVNGDPKSEAAESAAG
jgi:alpha-ketoglutarate-dependent taurine dioxygenase